MRREPTSRITSTYSNWNFAVTVTMKSQATIASAWFRTNVIQLCEEVLRPGRSSFSQGQYLRTVRGETKMPSLRYNSAATRICPQRGIFSRHSPNQFPYFLCEGRSARARLPPPEELESFPVPTDQRVRFHDQQRGLPMKHPRPQHKT